MILRVERAWGLRPGTFGDLPRDVQVRVLADHNLTMREERAARRRAGGAG